MKRLTPDTYESIKQARSKREAERSRALTAAKQKRRATRKMAAESRRLNRG